MLFNLRIYCKIMASNLIYPVYFSQASLTHYRNHSHCLFPVLELYTFKTELVHQAWTWLHFSSLQSLLVTCCVTTAWRNDRHGPCIVMELIQNLGTVGHWRGIVPFSSVPPKTWRSITAIFIWCCHFHWWTEDLLTWCPNQKDLCHKCHFWGLFIVSLFSSSLIKTCFRNFGLLLFVLYFYVLISLPLLSFLLTFTSFFLSCKTAPSWLSLLDKRANSSYRVATFHKLCISLCHLWHTVTFVFIISIGDIPSRAHWSF